MTGPSIYPLLTDKADKIYREVEPIGIEAAEHGALYKGDYKLVRNGKPHGDGVWRLYNISIDPGETDNLSESQSSKFAELILDYDNYTSKYGVLEIGINYEPLNEIQNKVWKLLVGLIRPWFIGVLLIVFGAFIVRK